MLTLAKTTVKLALSRSPALRQTFATVLQAVRSRDIPSARGALQSDPAALARIVAANRRLIAQSGSWIDEAALAKSFYKYGITDYQKPIYDDPIEPVPGLTDYLCCFAQTTRPLSYLEIGVSVGRNVWQMTQACEDATIYGLDIDDVYPVLAKKLTHVASRSFPSQHTSERTDPPRVEEFRDAARRNALHFICGDEFDHAVWAQLGGRSFNLIFSDAMHRPEAVLYEWGMLCDGGLIDRAGFTMVWDDLNRRGMRRAFDQICRDAAARFGLTPRNCAFQHIPGWVGRHEPPHPVGIISSLGVVA